MKKIFAALLFSVLAMPMMVNGQSNSADSQAAAKKRAIIVAVVDLPSLIKTHPVTVDEVPMLQEEFKKDAIEAQKKQQDYQKEMEKITKEYNIGTPQFEEAVRPIKDGMRELEAQMQDKQAAMQNRLVPLQYKVYADIQKAVDIVARDRGAVIVHAKVKIDRTGMSEELAAVKEADANGTLVWNREECDITNQVQEVLTKIAGAPKGGDAGSLNSLAAQAAGAAAGASRTNLQPAAQPRAASRLSNGTNRIQ